MPTADGVGILTSVTSPDNPSLLVNRNNGTITKVDTATSPPTLTVIYTGGTRGDLVATGSDGCLYATQTTSILKITAADGSCPFAAVVCTKVSTVPRVNLATANATAAYDDKQLTLTDGGVDGDHCGNRNESSDWTQIGGPTGTPHPVPPSGTLTLSPEKATSAVVGQQHPYTVTAVDADGVPVAGLASMSPSRGPRPAAPLKHLAASHRRDGSRHDRPTPARGLGPTPSTPRRC